MKRIYILPTAMLTLGLTAPAFANDTASVETKSETSVKKDSSGQYQRKETHSEKTTDTAGTTTSAETKVKVQTDADGNARKEVITETSTDPKGLMNKTKTVSTDSVTYKDGKVEKKHKHKINGKTVKEDTEAATEN